MKRPTHEVTSKVQQRIRKLIELSTMTHAEIETLGGFSHRWLDGVLSVCEFYDEPVLIRLARVLGVSLSQMLGQVGPDPLEEQMSASNRTDLLVQFFARLAQAGAWFGERMMVPKNVSEEDLNRLLKADLSDQAPHVGEYAKTRQLQGDLMEAYNAYVLQARIHSVLGDVRLAMNAVLNSLVPARHLAINSFLKRGTALFKKLFQKPLNKPLDMLGRFNSERCQVSFEYGWGNAIPLARRAAAIFKECSSRRSDLDSVIDCHMRREYHLIGEDDLNEGLSSLKTTLMRFRDRCDANGAGNTLLSIIALYVWHNQIEQAWEFLNSNECDIKLAPRTVHALMLSSKGHLLCRRGYPDEGEPFLRTAFEEMHKMHYCPPIRPPDNRGRSLGSLWRPDQCLPVSHDYRRKLGDFRERSQYPFVRNEPKLLKA